MDRHTSTMLASAQYELRRLPGTGGWGPENSHYTLMQIQTVWPLYRFDKSSARCARGGCVLRVGVLDGVCEGAAGWAWAGVLGSGKVGDAGLGVPLTPTVLRHGGARPVPCLTAKRPSAGALLSAGSLGSQREV